MTAAPAPLCRADVGSIELTYVPDGEIRADPRVAYPNADVSRWPRPDRLLDDGGLLVMSVGTILIRTRSHTLLIDLGAGPVEWDFARGSGGTRQGLMTGGQMLANLERLGVRPADIDAVLFSHLHIDHVGWTTRPGTSDPVFPNAAYYLRESELREWSRPEAARHPSSPSGEQLAVISAHASYLSPEASPFPGITVVRTTGHTAGHSSFMIEDSGQQALILGDAAHTPAELADPALEWLGDADREQSWRVRHHIARHLRESGATVAGPHFPRLIFGRMDHAGTLTFDPAQAIG